MIHNRIWFTIQKNSQNDSRYESQLDNYDYQV